MGDQIVNALAADGMLRAVSVQTTDIVQRARELHDLMPVATVALGRLLTASLLMSAGFKGQERLNIRVAGDGPLGALLADSGKGFTRGYVENPQAVLPANSQGKLDVAGGVGQGILYVVKDLRLKEPWSGSVPIVSGEIGEDITHYLTHSEQIPSAVGLGVQVTPEAKIAIAGGFLIQALPGCPDNVLAIMESRVQEIDSVSDQFAWHGSPEGVLIWLLAGLGPELQAPLPVEYRCDCSRERMARALVSLGKEEIKRLQDDQVQIVCHFCSKQYEFKADEVRTLLNQA